MWWNMDGTADRTRENEGKHKVEKQLRRTWDELRVFLVTK